MIEAQIWSRPRRRAPCRPTETRTMTGGQALVASLIAKGIDTLFALPGVQLDWAFDALYAERAPSASSTRATSRPRLHGRRLRRASGKLGVCLVVPGPGSAQRHGRRSRPPTPATHRCSASRARSSPT